MPITDLRAHRVPDLDITTGQRVSGWTEVEVYAAPHWVFALLPLARLPWLPARLVGRPGVRVELPVTPGTVRRKRLVEAGAVATTVAGLAGLAAGALGRSAALVTLGTVLLVVGVLGATLGLSRVWVRGRLEGEVIRLRGVHRAFADGVSFLRALGVTAPPGSGSAPPLVRATPPA